MKMRATGTPIKPHHNQNSAIKFLEKKLRVGRNCTPGNITYSRADAGGGE